MKLSIKYLFLITILSLLCFASCEKYENGMEPITVATEFEWTENTQSLPQGISAMGFSEVPNGLMIIGGKSTSSTLSETYIYEESTGNIVQGPNLTTARSHALCIALQNDNVLIIGGLDASGNVLTTCEIYDPASNTITATGSMDTAKARHKGALLNDGRVLVTGGTNVLDLNDFMGTIAATQATTEIYDPSTETWITGPTMTDKRVTHSMAVLPNGKVLISGGLAPNGFAPTTLKTCELFDPTSNTLSQTNDMNKDRAEHISVTMQDGKILCSGGGGISGMSINAISDAEQFDQSTETWTSIPNMNTSRGGHLGFVCSNGSILFPSGDSGSMTSITPTPTCEVYNPSSNSWSSVSDLSTAVSGYAGYITSDQKVVIIGGAISETALSEKVFIGKY